MPLRAWAARDAATTVPLYLAYRLHSLRATGRSDAGVISFLARNGDHTFLGTSFARRAMKSYLRAAGPEGLLHEVSLIEPAIRTLIRRSRSGPVGAVGAVGAGSDSVPVRDAALAEFVCRGAPAHDEVRSRLAVSPPRSDEPDLYALHANLCESLEERAELLSGWYSALNDRRIRLRPTGRRGQVIPFAFEPEAHGEGRSDAGGPLVSVIVAAFNAASSIEPALRSLLDQTHGQIEVIVVDDASSDDTAGIVERVASTDERVTLLRLPENRGVYFARNLGLQQSKGEFITFQDSDDVSEPGRIQAQLLRLTGASRAMACVSWWIRLDRQGATRPTKLGAYAHRNFSSLLMHRRVLDEIGFFDCVRASADSEYVARIERYYGVGTVAEVQKPLAIGLSRPGSLTRSDNFWIDLRGMAPDRSRYVRSYRAWHANARPMDLYVAFPPDGRRFPAPPSLTAGTDGRPLE
ncbi:MAG: glycosyltransferase family 2 protein [Deltaproteobacteria bacterium]|nr:glycosyltransferase family 2 protein [Deltaproteobacteria bacterium]MBW2413687.1 glycosyltransferase family 2 protein [Deltaproteobacteria bacterium]